MNKPLYEWDRSDLEAEVERLRAALEEIVATYPTTPDDCEHVAHYLAEKALGRHVPSPGEAQS